VRGVQFIGPCIILFCNYCFMFGDYVSFSIQDFALNLVAITLSMDCMRGVQFVGRRIILFCNYCFMFGDCVSFSIQDFSLNLVARTLAMDCMRGVQFVGPCIVFFGNHYLELFSKWRLAIFRCPLMLYQ
jgi:hypothetical protein